jgi:hypothetical protein
VQILAVYSILISYNNREGSYPGSTIVVFDFCSWGGVIDTALHVDILFVEY